MTHTLSANAKSELGKLLVDTPELIDLLALLPKEQLQSYPTLQKELISKHPNVRLYKRALKEGYFSKEEFRDRVFARLDMFAYELATTMNTDYLMERISLLVGDEIDRIDELSLQEMGTDVIHRILGDLSQQVFKHTEPKGDHPFLAERGRIDHGFWRHADRAFDAFLDGYTTQAALDAWCQLNLHTRCPQSFIRWLKVHGDPRELAEWREYAKG
ncbi:hypothetical protein [Ferrimonas sp. SCSIO 43195]|uniref:hypothetical protein n=1 Tax=Ferrimonas sp. SCSIO 43195 TaxID=2822844 RepID=UPI00207642EE|nr:hypothetical protein [Ferrimonas sp. SCSIO 43195]USD37727.1 hypothetical protein J8Z22_00620 [Ferrimonas sp. SCSIO 43195]